MTANLSSSGRSGGLVRLLFRLTLLGMVVAGLCVVGLYFYYAPTLPKFETIDDYRPKLGTRLYSADDRLIADFSEETRVLVPYAKVPPRLVQAFVSAEDKRFYIHQGVDPIGIATAIFDKIRHPDAKLRGASTITQQVAKLLLEKQEGWERAAERSIVRKVREAFLALRLEAALSKQDILYMYVNQVFLGHNAYGVQAASQAYFRKNVWELNLAEMATLAGLPQRPSDYSPYLRPEAAFARRRYVLRRMLEEGFIEQEEHDSGLEGELIVYPREDPYTRVAPYYAEQVRRELVEMFGEEDLNTMGLEVYTAVNIEAQAFARHAMEKGLRDLDKRQGFRGPLAQLDTFALRKSFVEAYRKKLKLDDPKTEFEPEQGGHYLALVEDFEARGTQVQLNVAGLKGVLPLAGMRWARKPEPTQRVDWHYLRDARRALKVGDVIMVRSTTRAELARDPHGWEIFDTVPRDVPLFALEQEPIAQAAVLSVDPHTGYVVAQVGGYDFIESSYNRAVQACREPGSAFKPVVYTAALANLGYTASTLIDDKPLVYDDESGRWKPNNAGLKFRGQLPLRTCLKDSINTPAIRVAEAVGIDGLVDMAERFGVKTPLKRELGSALGSSCTTLYDLIHVYVTLNQYGVRRQLRFIRRVVDRDGKVLFDASAPQDPTSPLNTRLDKAYVQITQPPVQVLDPQTAFLMVRLLRNVVNSGTGISASRIGVPAAGKTGTTNDSYDAWFMGFTEDLVTGVWVGHDKKERPLGINEQGGRTALPVWVEYMSNVLMDYTGDKPVRKAQAEFPAPPGIVQVSIDPETGLLARPDTPRAVTEFYREGSQPTEYTRDRAVMDIDRFDPFGADTWRPL